jgi:MEMO1 family protein
LQTKSLYQTLYRRRYAGWRRCFHGESVFRTLSRSISDILIRTLLCFCFVLLPVFVPLPAQYGNANVREPVAAGQFYPDDANQLRQEVRSFIDKAQKVDLKSSVMGLVVPHAGYSYSGLVAGLGYKQIMGRKYDVVIVFSPSHHDPFMGATIYPGESYQTPLGKVSIERELAAQIVQQCPGIKFSDLGHREEHSLEVQLPFIQVTMPQVPIVPIVVGGYDGPMLEKMAEGLSVVFKARHVLLIASSDFYHGNSYEECEATNTRTINGILAMKPAVLCDGFLKENYQACGGGPIVLMQTTLLRMGAKNAVLLGRTNSNDVTGQRGGYVVGYAAIAITGGESKMDNSNQVRFKPLNSVAQKELLTMAREAIKYYLEHHSIPVYTPTLDVLKEKRGVFVTLTEDAELRGCIGYHESDRPLYELVPDRAIAAAFQDTRFMPLRANELDKINIKISVYLTNVYRITSLDEFHMGEHGIIMMKNGRGATYLPEVPLEAGWKTVQEEMESLCHKAGLASDAWKQGAEFYVYKTQVFGEK